MADERLRRFEAALAGVPPSRVAGVWHRFVAESHKGDAEGDQGAFEYGGRYNPRREFGALYLSDSAAACAAGRHHNLVVFKDLMHRVETVRMEGIAPAPHPAS